MEKKVILVIFSVLISLSSSLAHSFQVLERVCEGNYLIAKVRELNGSIGYRILDYCYYGCAYGTCLEKIEVPILESSNVYEVNKCEDNVLFVKIKNEGTRGDIRLKVEGDAKEWIRVPSRITLLPNETKTIAIIASVPCNASGSYSFVLIGEDTLNFYSPFVLKIREYRFDRFKIPITTTITQTNLKIALVFSAIVLFIFIAYKLEFGKKKKEEKFE